MAPMRMTWWRELKWLLASHLLGWSLRLISEEMSDETALNFRALFGNMKNDPKFDTVLMRSRMRTER